MLLNSSGPAEPRWPRTNPRGSADKSERSAACWRKAATTVCSREAGGRDAEGRSGRSGDAYPPPIPLPGCGWRWWWGNTPLTPSQTRAGAEATEPPPTTLKMKLETWGRSTLGEPFGLASGSHLSSPVTKLFLEKSLDSSEEPKLGDHFLSVAWRGSIFQVL